MIKSNLIMKPFSYLYLGALVIGAGCSSSRNSQSNDNIPSATPLQQALTIDGSDKDWTKPLPGFSKSENLSYEIANDAENLYVLISTKDQLEQQKIIQGGMTVWINTKADKTQATAMGIGYPLDSRNDPDRNLLNEAQPDRQPRHITLEDKKDFALYGFGQASEVGNFAYADDTNPQGIRLRMDYNNAGELIYEAAIPLTTLYPGHSPSASYASKSIAVGIFVDGLPPNANVPRGAGGGGGGPAIGVGGGLGFGSFGSGGGLGLSIGLPVGGGGGGGRGRQVFKDAEIWQIVQLSNVKKGF
jgi:hypothetical protein